MDELKFGHKGIAAKNSSLWKARFSERYVTTPLAQAMHIIEHVNDACEPIYDSSNQWRYFAFDEVECERVLTHLWNEFGARGNVSVASLYAGPTFYQTKLNPDMCEEFITSRQSQNIVENVKATYWDGDIAMSELLLNPEYAALSDDDIDELLSWAGEDEFVNAEDIREGQALVEEREQDYERE